MRFRVSFFWPLLSCLCLFSSAHAQDSPPSPSSASPTETAAAAHSEQKPDAATTSDYSKEAFVIESSSLVVRFENDGTGRREGATRVRIQSDAGIQAWGQLRLGYNAACEKLEIPYVRVLKKDGSVITAGPEAIQELAPYLQTIAPVYTDYHEKHVTVPGLRPGDTLEFKTVTTFTPRSPLDSSGSNTTSARTTLCWMSGWR